MPVSAILGLQWGDEGKGKCVDYLSAEYDIVARCQGGANAGHTIESADQKIITHLLPAGVLQNNKELVIGNGVVIDLRALLEEIKVVERSQEDIRKRLFLSNSADVVLPFHKVLDKNIEQMRRDNLIGTTGRGIGPCYSDKARRIGLKLGHIKNSEALMRIFEVWSDFSNLDYEVMKEQLCYLKDVSDEITPMITNTVVLLNKAHKNDKKILLEGAQGALLDIDHGSYPFVTSSNTTIGGLITGSGLSPHTIDRIVGVAKAYTTRVGRGPFPTEDVDEIGIRMRELGREYGATTGRPRRCGWLDLVALKHAVTINGITEIALTKVDVLGEFPILKTCHQIYIKRGRDRLLPGFVM